MKVMDNLEQTEKIVRRLFDPKYERTNKYIAREVKNAYVQHVLESNWRNICGEHLEKHCCIHKIEKNTLIIRTASSVWANHLLLMKNLFLQKINAFLLGSVIIKDLKFYSGGQIKRYQTIQQKETEQPEIFSSCRMCGVPVRGKEDLCSVCAREQREKLGSRIAELLVIQPWLSYEECLDYCKCDRILFTAVRDRVQNKYFEKVRLGSAGKSDCLLAVMFLTGRKPEEIDKKLYANTLEYLRRDQSVPASGLRLHGKKQRNNRYF